MEKAGDKLILPVDTVVAKEFSNDAPSRVAEMIFNQMKKD